MLGGASNVVKFSPAFSQPNYSLLLRVEGGIASYSVVGLGENERSRAIVARALESLAEEVRKGEGGQGAR